MNLKIYLVRNRITTDAFAKAVGCTRTHLSQIMHGKKRPGLPLAKMIEVATNGEITAEEILAEYKEKEVANGS